MLGVGAVVGGSVGGGIVGTGVGYGVRSFLPGVDEGILLGILDGNELGISEKLVGNALGVNDGSESQTPSSCPHSPGVEVLDVVQTTHSFSL